MPEPAVVTALLPLPLTLAIAIIDLRRQVIPDLLNLALLMLGLGLAAALADDGAWKAVGLAGLQAGSAYLLFRALRAGYARWRGRTGLGLGDVKLLAAAASIVGLAGLPLMVLVASLTALVVVAAMGLSGRIVDARTRLPFGPFLVLGLHVAALFGPQAVQASESIPKDRAFQEPLTIKA